MGSPPKLSLLIYFWVVILMPLHCFDKKLMAGRAGKFWFLAFSVLSTSMAHARAIITDETINNSAPVEDFIIGRGATLTVNNAETLNISSNASKLVVNAGTLQDIRATNGSTVTLDRATVTARANQPAVTITNSTAVITNSTITSDTTGLQVGRIPSAPRETVVSLIGTTVTGGIEAAVVSAQTTLNLTRSDLISNSANGYGLRLASGDVFAQGGSIVGGMNGILLSGDNFIDRANTLVLDGTRVSGGSGAAIAVDSAGRSIVTNVHVRNGADLVSGNGNLLEVGNGGLVNLTVDNSALTGNVEIANGASANITLQNDSSLSGNLHNAAAVNVNNRSFLKGDIVNDVPGGASVVIDSASVVQGNIYNSTSVDVNNGAQWKMTGNNLVSKLHLNGGTVDLTGGDAFNRVDIVNLSGTGVFAMRADLAADESDFLNVSGTATGSHQLLIAASANDPASGNPLKIGNIATGDAAFSLLNGSVDAGAFTYKLLKEGEGLYLAPDKETVSTGTNTALAIAATAPTILYAEMTTLNNRLGDRRLNGAEPSVSARSTGQSQAGVWIRTYSNQYNVDNAYGDGYSQSQKGVSVGADAPLPIGDGQWLAGGFVGYSKTEMDLKRGSNATVNSGYLGGYLTWYDAATGFYVDTVTKINQFDNSAKVTMSDGTRTKGDYKNLALSGSVEVGKHIAFENGVFLEPFTQVAAAIAQGKDYTLDNGLRVSNDHTRSLVGKVGTTVGSEMALANGGKLQPRLKVALSQEFIKNNKVTVNDTQFNDDLSATAVELGAGINWTPTKKAWQVYSEVNTSTSKTVSQDWSASVGVSYNF
ncbi:autotransporter outer membrane beta-barrel domain-containing protein [Pseudomonas sp. Irchel s3h9]|uniref:autotransporter outer membrane beta-barrel domain-containing protein n=1 Tax=Pseudomonas sp. Irchel s3h9 TaxID=2009192 RepID=UPI000BA4B938|nr:autotransporter outer membrane beta-barrel domain-containing protein [Pseudomonas sp. Irchel s3h9]